MINAITVTCIPDCLKDMDTLVAGRPAISKASRESLMLKAWMNLNPNLLTLVSIRAIIRSVSLNECNRLHRLFCGAQDLHSMHEFTGHHSFTRTKTNLETVNDSIK